MGDMHLVLPALNLSSLNAGILIMMHQVRLNMLGGVGWWVAHEILVSAQGPLVLALGLRVWGQGLTKRSFSLLPGRLWQYRASSQAGRVL